MRGQLKERIMSEIESLYSRPVNKETQQFAKMFRDEFGDSVVAVVAYGSKFFGKPSPTSIHDFFIVVDKYKDFYKSHKHPGRMIALNTHFPPNIFNYEREHNGVTYNAKYNVLTLKHLTKLTGMKNNDIYVSGRFQKLMGIAYTKDNQVKQELYNCIFNSIRKHMRRTLLTLPHEFSLEEFCKAFVGLGYKADFRVKMGAEKPGKIDDIYLSAKKDYDKLYGMFLQELVVDGTLDHSADIYTKTMSAKEENKQMNKLDRYLKSRQHFTELLAAKNALFTFHNPIGYAIAKKERASGETLDPEKYDPKKKSTILRLLRDYIEMKSKGKKG